MSGTIPAEFESLDVEPAILTKGVTLPVAFAATALAATLRKGKSIPVVFAPTDAVPNLLARTIGGAQGPAGRYSTHTFAANGALVSFSKNRITANNVALTLPAAPADFDDILVTVESGLTGCSIIAPGGVWTVGGVAVSGGVSTLLLDITPCAVWIIANADPAVKNWFLSGLKT